CEREVSHAVCLVSREVEEMLARRRGREGSEMGACALRGSKIGTFARGRGRVQSPPHIRSPLPNTRGNEPKKEGFEQCEDGEKRSCHCQQVHHNLPILLSFYLLPRSCVCSIKPRPQDARYNQKNEIEVVGCRFLKGPRTKAPGANA